MLKSTLILLLFVLFLPLSAQKLREGTYWVNFSDKTGNGYSLDSPGEFLSQRSLERRSRQNIPLTDEDLPVSKIYLDSLKTLGISVWGSSRWYNGAIIESYDTLLLDTLSRYSFIAGFDRGAGQVRKKAFESNSELKITQAELPPPPEYNYGISYPQIALLNGKKLHELGFRGEGMQIAVIDGGFWNADIYDAFDSLRNEGRLLGFRDFSRSNSGFFKTASHGMSVLSTMAANIPGELIGTAPKASYWLLKSEIVESETPLEEALWLLAAEFADSVGVDVINSSLGYSEFDDTTFNYSYSDMDGKTTLVTKAAEKAFSKGMIVVNSAGNSGSSAWKYITAPADGENVLAIGSCDSTGMISGFSSRGPSYDQRIKPDVIAVGSQAVVVNSIGTLSLGYGTSFSSPQVAGMVACLWEAVPQKTNKEIINAIRQSGQTYRNPDSDQGYGIPNFLSALYSLNSFVPLSGSNGEMLIIPNPNNGVFDVQIKSLSAGIIDFSIYNSLGKKVYSDQRSLYSGLTRVSGLQGLGAGIYLIVAKSGNNTFHSNLMVL